MNKAVRVRIRVALRRARDPLLLPRPELERSRFEGIVLVPSAAYHVEELWPLAFELRTRGRTATFVTTRADPHSVLRALRTHSSQEPLYAWPRAFPAVPAFDAVVVMNDWGPTRKLVELARARGVPSFAKVEGVQDFDDENTGAVRLPYRSSSVILAQGTNDAAALGRDNVYIVGSTRLERLWHGEERHQWNEGPVAIINSNFTYGVLHEYRTGWLDQALAGCRAAGVRPLISQHPADPPLPPEYPVSRRPVSDLLSKVADVLISRFSTVPFEAMARGVPFIYLRPAAETIDLFSVPSAAHLVAEDPQTLAKAILEALRWRGSYRSRAAPFFRQQVDIATQPAESRAAEVILESLASSS